MDPVSGRTIGDLSESGPNIYRVFWYDPPPIQEVWDQFEWYFYRSENETCHQRPPGPVRYGAPKLSNCGPERLKLREGCDQVIHKQKFVPFKKISKGMILDPSLQFDR